MTRHRIALVPYASGWSYDSTAQALRRHLADRFEIDVFTKETLPQLRAGDYALIVDMWWHGTLHRRYGRHVAKQVSSHRWAQLQYGRLDAPGLVSQHLRRNATVLVPSRRLQVDLAPHVSRGVHLCPKGFDPLLFGDDAQRKAGPLRVGWAGIATAADKRLDILRDAWPDLHAIGPGTPRGQVPYDEMGGWYNSVDVITCASDAEGDPRPLIEGLACGCFPVTVNVGVVPELVSHGVNGIVVERTAGAFRAAIEWCASHVDQVREAGRRNAVAMRSARTWAITAQAWGDAFDAAIASLASLA